MVALFIASLEKGAGKTVVCAGLAKHFLVEGRKVGYFKPFSTASDSDVPLMKQMLSLDDTAETIAPSLSNDKNALNNAYNKVAQGKDIVIIEAVYDPAIIQALDAKAIIVEDYYKKSKSSGMAYKDSSKSTIGIVLNKVPKKRVENQRAEMAQALSKANVPLLAVISESRVLVAPTVSALASSIGGKFVGSANPDEIIENIMFGAMTVDSGPYYYNRKNNKAAVIRTDRPDMQLAALQTSTKALVLSGDGDAKSIVLSQALQKGVSVIMTAQDMASIAVDIDENIAQSRFSNGNRLGKTVELIENSFDFKSLYKSLGIK